ncbi:MAG: peptidase S10 [Candidatus Promineifilaceae bacterium]
MSEDEKNKDEKKPAIEQEPEEVTAVTQHTITLNGETISYTVTAGTMLLKEEEEKDSTIKTKASIFYVAYTKNGVDTPGNRPITFSFNGGPGSSSVWLHMGLLGPKRVVMADDIGSLPAPPYQLTTNEYTILDKSDLVFIDPVSTGYSRSVPGEKPKQFHNFEKDIESVGEFIRLYTTRNMRWASPKFLAGESYGTTRAAGLSGFLQKRYGMYLNGIMLISSILNFQTARFTNGNDLPYILFLPTYTAVAWYHNRLDNVLQTDLYATLAEVEKFALGEYALALLRGTELPQAEYDQIVEKLARYTGLSPAYIRGTKLRINIHRFVKELLRDEMRTVGRLDGRFTGIDRDSVGEKHSFDPSYTNILGPYTAMFNDYIRRELNFEMDLPYEILTGKVQPWGYDKQQNEFVDVAETLREAISMNPYLKVLVANGYYDLATPYFATRYTFNNMPLDPTLRQNITMTYYEAGHMMYLHMPSLAQLKQDMDAFIEQAWPAGAS